jgi:hypothetical protein
VLCFQDVRSQTYFFNNGNQNKSYRIGFPPLAGSKIDTGLKQIGQETKIILQ